MLPAGAADRDGQVVAIVLDVVRQPVLEKFADVVDHLGDRGNRGEEDGDRFVEARQRAQLGGVVGVGHRIDATSQDGTLAPPDEQTFWTARAEGPQSTVEVDWDFQPGRYTLVLMNADGTPGVDADASVELEVPFLETGLWIALGVGAALFLIGLLIALFVARGPKAPPAPVAPRRRPEPAARRPPKSRPP